MKGENKVRAGQVNEENPIAAIHQTHYILRRLEDQIFAKHGLTTEQYEVLMAVKYLKAPVKITDVAIKLVRSTNSISMIVDRMVRAGLLNRVRDEDDRRTVHVSNTDRAETILKSAMPAAQKFIQDTLLPLTQEEIQNLLRMLGEIA